jgi:hypothetical protein
MTQESLHNAKPPAPLQAQPGELLFEFLKGHDRIRCELRDHGEPYGVEAQFFRNEFNDSRRFDRLLDPTRRARWRSLGRRRSGSRWSGRDDLAEDFSRRFSPFATSALVPVMLQLGVLLS